MARALGHARTGVVGISLRTSAVDTLIEMYHGVIGILSVRWSKVGSFFFFFFPSRNRIGFTANRVRVVLRALVLHSSPGRLVVEQVLFP